MDTVDLSLTEKHTLHSQQHILSNFKSPSMKELSQSKSLFVEFEYFQLATTGEWWYQKRLMCTKARKLKQTYVQASWVLSWAAIMTLKVV